MTDKKPELLSEEYLERLRQLKGKAVNREMKALAKLYPASPEDKALGDKIRKIDYQERYALR